MGRFVWCELMTSAPEAAARFYADVLGWRETRSPVEHVAYRLMGTVMRDIAGIMPMPERAAAAGARPAWIGYLGVRDIASECRCLSAAGGAVYRQPFEIPGVGQIAIVADPQGAMFALLQPDAAMLALGATWPSLTGIGHVGWHELYANDPEAAMGFYGGLYGWSLAETLDLGRMGPYLRFAAGGELQGGMMRRPESFPAPHWIYYFNVADMSTAVEKITAGGGQIMAGPSGAGRWISISV